MNFKSTETQKALKDWIVKLVDNRHPLDKERFHQFVLCLCLYEDSFDYTELEEHIKDSDEAIFDVLEKEKKVSELINECESINNFFMFLKEKGLINQTN